jgi:hypothetical protein
MDPRTAATKRVPNKDLETVWNTRTVVMPPLARAAPTVAPEPPTPSFDDLLESRRASDEQAA